MQARSAPPLQTASTPFQPPRWLGNAHAQTLWRKFFPPAAVAQRRERLTLEDGDFIDIDWAGPPPQDSADSRLAVLLHGLCGSSRSPYIVELQRALADSGVASVAMNFRGCSGEYNLLPRAYHSGVAEDLDEVFTQLQRRHRDHKFLFAGYSLGASVLLNWLANRGEAARGMRAAAVSTPFQLALCSQSMLTGMSRHYGSYFVRLLTRDFDAKRRFLEHRAPESAQTLAALLRQAGPLDTLWDFDDQLTAPLHGFRGAEDYYLRCSSGSRLSQVQARTLLLQSADDPLIPPAALPTDRDLGSRTELELSRQGGHVGFIARGARPWLETRVAQFLLGSD